MATPTDGNPPVEKDNSVDTAANGIKEVPSPSHPSKKVRILCLHGFRTSGKILEQQIQSANWAALVEDIADLVFMDGPCPAKGKSAVEKYFEGPYFEWYQSSPDWMEVSGVDEAASYFHNYVSLHGPFDGVLGFSQGGVLAAALIGLAEKGLGPKIPEVNFMIMVGAGRDPAEPFQPAYTTPINCPSIHFLGEKDFFKSFSETLIPLCKDPIVVRHPFGHVVPKLGGSEGQILRDFLLKQQQAKLAS